MTAHKNSLSQQLEATNRQHANAVALSNAYTEALTSMVDEVEVDLVNADDTVSKVKIKTNTKIWYEIERLRSTILNMSGLAKDRQNTLVSVDDTSSFREIFTQTYDRSYSKAKSDEISFDSVVKTQTNSVVESLLSPLTTVETTLAERFLEANEVNVTKFTITTGDFSIFSEGETYSSVLQKLSDPTNEFIYTETEYLLDTIKRDTRYYGEFDVESSTVNEDSSITVMLNTVNYSDKLNAVENSRVLVPGNKVVLTNGLNRYNVESVDNLNKTVVLKSEAGYAALVAGDEVLSILSVETNETRQVRIPVKMNERSVMFVSPVNKHTNAESPYSEAKIFDSSNYTVEVGNNTFSFDEYFSSKVADLGAYFEAIVRESAIPASLGQKPEKPTIESSYFNVVQINKHLTNTPETEKLKALQSDYTRTQSEISVLNKEIRTINSRIAKGNYASSAAKSKDEATQSAKIKTKNEKSAYVASLVTDINSALNNTSSRSVTPKYRVRGFWPVQDDILSSVTDPQKIVQYEVRFRYTANNKTTTDADQMTYTDKNNNTVNAIFSPWSNIKTEPRTKVITDDGEYAWTNNDVSSSEQNNMNQLDISIQYGENVELQIRAISEAGYPNSPMMSDWSNLTQVIFPQELLQESSIATIARENSEAVRKVELEEEFRTQGITEHVSTAIEERGIYFAHDSKQIASGFRTSEQTIISLFDFLTTLKAENEELKSIVFRTHSVITPQIVESTDKIYDVANFQTLKLFAGYYTDSVALSEPANFGTIVTKVFYIRFNNKNAQTIDILTLSPGSLSANTTNANYSNVPISILGQDGTSQPQKNGQIFYNRSVDISGSTEFFVEDNNTSVNTVPSADIDSTAASAAKNCVHINSSGNVEVVKLATNASLDDYVVISTSHPVYQGSGTNTSDALAEFERIKQFNSTYREDIKQNTYDPERAVEYVSDDKYTVGRNSVGSRLFTQVNQMSSVQVNGINSASSLEIHAGDSNSIIVPIVFQYRMTDALGHVDGSTLLTTNSNFEYTKTMGIDLIIKGETFQFDVEVSAKFRPTSVSNNNLGIQTLNNIESTSDTGTKII